MKAFLFALLCLCLPLLPQAAGTDAHLADGLLDPAHGIGVIGLVEVQDAHGRPAHP